jgi:hypothetical protein
VIVYDEERMKATFTFDIERCMEPGHRYYFVQAKIRRESDARPAGRGKSCRPVRWCRISISMPHDPIEVRAEYNFEADYPGPTNRPVVNYIGPYYCTSLIVEQGCSTD